MSSKRYDQLIADLRSDYRPQREWGEGRGILMVIGHFLTGVAGGTWLMASIFGVPQGLFVAFAAGVLGGIVHLLFLGRPERAFNMVRHVRTSWVSRGFVGLGLFLMGGGLYLAIITLLPPGGVWNLVAIVAQVIAAIGTVTIIGYMGFCYAASKAIPFWNSPLHPAIYIAFALRGGIAALLVVAVPSDATTGDSLLRLWIGVTAIIVLLLLIEIYGAMSRGNVAARWSARDMLAGRLAVLFYGGTLTLGLIVPLLLLLGTSAFRPPVVMAFIGLASVAGDFFMKASIVKAGVYLPLVLPLRRQGA